MHRSRPGSLDRQSLNVDRRQWRLRRRVFGSVLMAGVILIPFILGILWAGAATVEDALLKRRLQLEVERLISAKESGAELEPSPFFQFFWGFDQIAEPFRSATGEIFWGFYKNLDELQPGIYEIRGAKSFVAIVDRFKTPLIVFFDVTGLEPLEDLELTFFSSAGVILGLATVGVALALARRLDREVVVPIQHLADAVAWDLQTWKERRLASEGRADEIGHLARSTRRASLRQLGFLEREREFTRNASHELRNPLTVVKGATELLRSHQAHDLKKPLDRIDRAVRHMESTIETFLFLAREGNETPDLPSPIRPLVDECLESLPRHPDRNHRIQIEIAKDLCLPISAKVLRILLDNLIGNALRHGAAGDIDIDVQRDRIRVSNPLVAPLEKAEELTQPFVGEGSGLGLTIVEELCRRHGWALELESSTGKGSDRLQVIVNLEG